jgi:hypothetical protein
MSAKWPDFLRRAAACGQFLAWAYPTSSEEALVTQPSESLGPLAEFTALRQEIDQRISRKYAMVMTQLTLSGAIFGFVLGDARRVPLLLVVPISSYVLCSHFIRQARWVAHIGTYIRLDLSPRVPGGLHWGDWLRDHPPIFGRTFPRFLWVAPLLLTFPGISLLSLIWTATAMLGSHRSLSGLIVPGALWLFDLGITGLSAALSIEVIQRHWSHHDLPTARRVRPGGRRPIGRGA